MSVTDNLSPEDKEFLAKCEEEFKDRYTDKDEEFMKVFNAEKSVPPIVKSWSRNDRWNSRPYHPYDNRNRNRDYRNNQDKRGRHERRSGYDRRAHNDYNRSYIDNHEGGYRHRQ